MKTKIIIFSIIVFSVIACNNKQEVKNAKLSQNELKTLGVNLQTSELFYNNINPNAKAEIKDDKYLSVYLSKGMPISFFSMTNGEDTLKTFGFDKWDSLFMKIPYTNKDYYPLLISQNDGSLIYDKYFELKLKSKLFPVEFCMKDKRFLNRVDTLLIWFNITPSLQSDLGNNYNVNEFARIPIFFK